MAFLLISCNESQRGTGTKTGNGKLKGASVNTVYSRNSTTQRTTPCPAGESLIYGDETFDSYTEDTMRGTGIISFLLMPNDRLTILNEDDSNFGEIVLNEDRSYFTLTMPKKVVARRLITTPDFETFEFDAENVNASKDYLFIYVNKEKKKVKKSGLNFTFYSWENYIKEQSIELKDCNLLTDAKGKANPKSKGLAFKITDLKGDEIKIKSTKDCLGEDGDYQDLKGKLKWKSGNVLLIDIALCN